jgi:Tol biopolymer transport system component
LAYSASFNNGPPHVYVTAADANMQTTDLKVGKDPAWHPRQDLLVFNGFDLDGSNPGLKVMSADGDGSDRRTLTDNGNDQRPTWSPDGQTIVFMSKDRGNLGNNWELYRYEYATSEIELLTDGDPAQDGLPAISPDGRWVVFMSDRGGRWKLWYVSIDGGPVYLLSDISGQPVAWLEHAIQWVR